MATLNVEKNGKQYTMTYDDDGVLDFVTLRGSSVPLVSTQRDVNALVTHAEKIKLREPVTGVRYL